MNKVKYLRKTPLYNLKNNIESNLEFYKENHNSWLDMYFNEDNYSLELKDGFNIKFDLLKGGGYKNDFENVKIIYDNFKRLTPAQASDERLWSYLTHVNFWSYMDERWSVKDRADRSDERLIKFINRRYFLGSGNNTDRDLSRNGIARLWWYGHISYDESNLDKYHLTRVLLTQQDFAQHLLESAFTRNQKIINYILTVFKELDKKYVRREYIRPVTEYLNMVGGITILDRLNKKKIKKIIYNRIALTE